MKQDYSVADEIIKLKNLLDAGIISSEEFETQKQKLLSPQKQISELPTSDSYKVILLSYPNDMKVNTISIIRQITGLSLADAKSAVESLPFTVKSNVSLSECQYIEKEFLYIGCKIKIENAAGIDIFNQITNQSKTKSDPPNYIQKEGQSICCPKCGSTSIVTGARGVNFTTGTIGASKTVNRCANCGHMWKPTISNNTTNTAYDPNATKGLGYLWLGFIGIIILLIIIYRISY